ncbi:uncharacterized protein PgNI_07880 [Pyricularia grisea]|uniref:NADH:flavin oxidoreductase/NADH oxidase N-terminal domain-containing protein n=1 Tax=Pyricularia grisea TaxID=148305 RepID=A0A6P8B188_PYRGI|nr:uncharacterized protein PgNI_07880 [Pyricularia grisea]TLD08596.1 hypothetical protein PgNI_07880 [Pyricularia grisea]
MSKLFTPLKVGNVQLAHRIAMAPMTRFRADDDHSPLDIVAEYYKQRACVPGTLLISEATLTSPRAGAYKNAPGIWTKEHIAGWKAVTEAVHSKGSFIYLQLWNLGRTADPKASDQDLISASAVPQDDKHPTPREMTEEEIQQAIQDYATAAKNAIEAGFDGVEVHAANGYLIDQFLQDTCNKRTDGWGGSVEKRARFALEVTRAVVEAVGADRTGIRLSPYGTFQGMLMADPAPTFGYVVDQLRPFGLAYLHFVESEDGDDRSVDWLVRKYDSAGPVLVANGFTPESAKKAVDETYKDLDVVIAFGRLFIPNPDLVFRIEKGVPTEPIDPSGNFYEAKSPKRFIDFPFSSEYQASVKAN